MNKWEGEVSEEECFEAIKIMKKNKSPGHDGLPIEFFIKLFGQKLKTY